MIRTGTLALLALVSLTSLAGGCGKLLGIEDLRGADAGGPPPDGPQPDMQMSSMIRFTGLVQGTRSQAPERIPGAKLSFFKLPEDTRVASATAETDGTYTLDVPNGNKPLDGYVRVNEGGEFNVTYHYLGRPVTRDTQLDLDLFEGSFLKGASQAYGTSHDPIAPALFVQVIDQAPVAGVAMDQVSPLLLYHYNDGFGVPDPNATTTGVDGRAFLFNAPTGDKLTVSGSRTGATYGPRTTRQTEPATCYFVTIHP